MKEDYNKEKLTQGKNINPIIESDDIKSCNKRNPKSVIIEFCISKICFIKSSSKKLHSNQSINEIENDQQKQKVDKGRECFLKKGE